MAGNRHRIGIVGGNANRAWAHDAHVPALRKMTDRFVIEAVSARTQELADEANAAFGGNRAFGDSLALVRDSDVDVVAVSVKVPEHRAVVLAALAAGKHVYCEWPLGRDLAEAEQMAAAVPKGAHVMIGTQALSAPAVLHARRLIEEGHLGDLQVCRVFSPTVGWGDSAPPHYAYLQDKANGATLETIAGGHTLSMMEYLLGAYVEVDARNTIMRRQVPITGSDEMVERTCADHMLVLGRHESGCVSTLEVTGGVANRDFSLELVGTRGSLTMSSSFPGGYQAGTIVLETSFGAPPVPAHVVEGLRYAPVNVAEAWARFADDIENGTYTVPDFEGAVRLTRLLDAIDAASASGQRAVLR
ncbi:MAG: Gfo/Idh/MocA family oxidoreductase [Alphaproteobacteria bacterium]|nr:Gfo/Idh/MocA family oxidoreductase [Alphaproteobacteria bacterium]